MAMDEPQQVVIREFQGMVSNRNPHNLEPGRMIAQVNCLVRRPGELMVRGGLREQVSDAE